MSTNANKTRKEISNEHTGKHRRDGGELGVAAEQDRRRAEGHRVLHARRAIGKRELHAPTCILLRIRSRRPEGFHQSSRVAVKGTGNHLRIRSKRDEKWH